MSDHRILPKVHHLPQALYRAEQVRELDRLAIEEYGIPGELLMERAGEAAWRLLEQRWPNASRILVLVGTGNNGGDGFVVARLALQAGRKVTVLQLGDRDRISGDARSNALKYAALSGDWRAFEGRLPDNADLLVDGIFGTGLEREVSGTWAEAIRAANAHRAPVLALDLPSGLHADTGAVLGAAVRAEATISFIGLKQGMFTGEGPACCGEIFFDSLEVPARLYGHLVISARRIDWARQRDLLQPRVATAHKGHFGHVLVIGGDRGMGGAARLAAEAALRTGAGLVSLATRPEHVAPVLASRPEIMAHGIEEPLQLDPLLRNCTHIAIGPGLGRDDWGRMLLEMALAAGRPLVVDADGLNLLAEAPVFRDDWVLTPHPGEAARLLDSCVAEIQADRFAAVEQLQHRYGGVAVLKGAGTLVASGGDRRPAVCSDGNPGMASGGMGDVLTGVVAGWLAQGQPLAAAAELAVTLHGAAADKAARAGRRGLLAMDLMSHVRRLANPDNE